MPDNPLLTQIRKAYPLISVGVLTADLMSLGSELELMNTAESAIVVTAPTACNGTDADTSVGRALRLTHRKGQSVEVRNVTRPVVVKVTRLTTTPQKFDESS